MSQLLAPQPESAQLNCPKCQTLITYYDMAGSEYYACPHCHAYFRWSGEEIPRIIDSYQDALRAAPFVPLGTLGLLAGSVWRVVGAVSRHEAKHPQYSWREYQLFQAETNSYMQLAEFDGHWTLIWEAGNSDTAGGEYRLADFKVFNKYQSRINWALGEFDWNIEGDKSLNVTEYIKPPLMLVQEQRGKQRNWYRGRHMAPEELAAAFGLSRSALPPQDGTGAVQPAPGSESWPALRNLTGIVVALLLLAQLLLSLRGRTPVLHQELQVPADAADSLGAVMSRVLVSSSFTLDHQTAVEIDLNATLSNQWLELPVSLVNEQTGQGFEFTKNIEFYSGVEGGESWTEGSRATDALLTHVPAGRYHLNFYPITEKGVAPLLDVTVWADPTLLSNFFIVLGLVLLYPGWQFFRLRSHEANRWENSDYSPYASE